MDNPISKIITNDKIYLDKVELTIKLIIQFVHLYEIEDTCSDQLLKTIMRDARILLEDYKKTL